MNDIRPDEYFYFILDHDMDDGLFVSRPRFRSYKAKIQKIQNGKFKLYVRYYDDLIIANSNEEVLLKFAIKYGKPVYKMTIDYRAFVALETKWFDRVEDITKMFEKVI